MEATDTLRHEHEAVKLMLQIMEAVSTKIASGQSVQHQDLDDMIDFFKVFVDRCHHGKEEELLFPLLETAGMSKDTGPIGLMLAEHAQGREYIRNISLGLLDYQSGDLSNLTELTKNMQVYIELLNEHVHKENEVLLVMADKLLTEEVQKRLYCQFEELEENVIGLGKHEEMHLMLEKMSDNYLV